MSFCSWAKQEIHRDNFSPGTYVCSKCEYPLFSSTEKYKHHTPWPAFTNPVHKDSLIKKMETNKGLVDVPPGLEVAALKVLCGKCGNPLGHEFKDDGPGGKGSRF